MENWYEPGNFFPRGIYEDPAFLKLTHKEQKVYLELCKHSYLTKKTPHRRYIKCTYEQLAKWSGFSLRLVKYTMPKFLKSRLAIRWFKGNVRRHGSRYELPANIKHILRWRINLKPQK